MIINNVKVKKKIGDQKGLTLLELIVVIALLGIVISTIFSFQSFGTKIFHRGVTQADIQSSLRMTSDFIIHEVRNATEITLSTPANPDDYNQIYISGNKVKYKPAGGTEINKTDVIIENPTDVQFTLATTGSNYTLNFSMIGTSKTNTYDLSSDVMLNNIRTATILANSQSIYYKKDTTLAVGGPPPPPPPPPPPTTPLTANLSTPNNNTTVTIVFNKEITSVSQMANNLGVAVTTVISDLNKLVLTSTSQPGNNKSYKFSVTDVDGVITQYEVIYKNSGNWQGLTN
jgi:prepilin-type N-terminal cleavage/methylation domain-containing protein